MERLVEWNSKEKNSAFPKCINEWGDTVSVEDICAQLATIYDILGDDYDLPKLRELVEADRDGRCVVLPCKVGDCVYISMDIPEYGVREVIQQKVRDLSDAVYYIPFIGKTVFLTREAAEAALKGDSDG